jgi:hypothetical protein
VPLYEPEVGSADAVMVVHDLLAVFELNVLPPLGVYAARIVALPPGVEESIVMCSFASVVVFAVVQVCDPPEGTVCVLAAPPHSRMYAVPPVAVTV